jgi:hypothetical protein
MPKEGSLLHRLNEMVQPKDGKSRFPLQVEVALKTGARCVGQIHAVFEDGVAIKDKEWITFVPLSGLVSVTFASSGLTSLAD